MKWPTARFLLLKDALKHSAIASTLTHTYIATPKGSALTMTDRLSNTYSETMGGVKEKIGHALGNERLAGHGATQKAEAQANKQAEAEHVKGLGNQAEGKAQKAVGGAANDPSMEARGHGNEAMGDVQRSV